MIPRSSKLYDVAGHTSGVTCLCIGRKSGRVMISGGEDKRVNLWAVGKPQMIMSLAGHTATIESVTLDWPEEIAVAGAANGTIKLWDLEHSKVVTLEFHPFGEFFASGSSDSTCKIWDVRKKGCIQTYHNEDPVSVLKISPDGKWIVCGSSTGTVKIWDMTAGRLLHTYQDHRLPISSIAFNPSEFSMATLSADQTFRLYDLSTLQHIAMSTVEGRPGLMEFGADGSGLIVATSAGVTAWTFEPTILHDIVAMPWDNSKTSTMSPFESPAHSPSRGSAPAAPTTFPPLADIKIIHSDNRLVAATLRHSFMSLWAVDLSRVSPICSQSGLGIDIEPSDAIKSLKYRIDGQAPELKGGEDPDDTPRETEHMDTSLKRRALGWGLLSGPFSAGHEGAPRNRTSLFALTETAEMRGHSEARRVEGRISSRESSSTGRPSLDTPLDIPSVSRPENAPTVPPPEPSPIVEDVLSRNRRPREDESFAAKSSFATPPHDDNTRPRDSQSQHQTPPNAFWPSDMPAFISSKKPDRSTDAKNAEAVAMDAYQSLSDLDILEELSYRHHSVLATLANRLTSFKLLIQHWDDGNHNAFVEAASRKADLATWNEFLKALILVPKGLTLDACLLLLPLLSQLLTRSTDEYMISSLEMTRILTKLFSVVICSNLASSPGVDLTKENRVAKSVQCYNGFREIASSLRRRVAEGSFDPLERDTLTELEMYFPN